MIDRTLSHYRILHKIGEGGMGEVFLAEDTRLERKTAIKLLSPTFSSDPERLARFDREAKAVAALNHPNIVTIYSVEQEGDLRFLTMELVEGSTLDEIVPEEGCPTEQFFDIAIPLADAVAAAHGHGVTHRDLKPANVMVNDEGRVKVLDFGLAKLLEEGRAKKNAGYSTETLTTPGRVLGTIPYMSPEQLKGGEVDHRSDVFSLGVLLYEMATGERPFAGETAAELISAILRDEPARTIDLNFLLPEEVGELIELCLRKDPDDRIQSAHEIRDRLLESMRAVELEAAWISGDGAPARRVERSARSASGLRRLVSTRTGLTVIPAIVFGVNWVETAIERRVNEGSGLGTPLGHRISEALHGLEGFYTFQHHDATNALAVYGYSVSYFFLFPLLVLAVALALARRSDLAPYRVFSFSIAGIYALSLPFFVFFPVPERWAHPDSSATLLSDQWTTSLIETIRPISGLDNSFPSFHVSLTVAIVLICYLFRARMRTTVLALGMTVLLSTYVLGIHWMADILAGAAVGVLGVFLAVRLDRALAGRTPAPAGAGRI
jgi:membrane-associated phospholipid phosphatase